MWKETPIPIYFKIYLFNWTNSDAVLKNWNVKPKLEQCGPYTFSEHHIRVNMTWNDNGTITYQQKRIWHFLPEMSNGTLEDKITNVNVIAAVSGSGKNLRKIIKIRNVLFLDRGLSFKIPASINKTICELLLERKRTEYCYNKES